MSSLFWFTAVVTVTLWVAIAAAGGPWHLCVLWAAIAIGIVGSIDIRRKR